jgi:hypothetical protein
MVNREATNTNFIVFGLTPPGLEPTTSHTQSEHANHCTTVAVYCGRKAWTDIQYVWLSQYLAEKCWNLYIQISHHLLKMQVISFNQMGLVFKFQLITFLKIDNYGYLLFMMKDMMVLLYCTRPKSKITSYYFNVQLRAAKFKQLFFVTCIFPNSYWCYIYFNQMGLVFKFQLIWWIKGYAECSKGKLNKCILKAIVDTVTWLKQ